MRSWNRDSSNLALRQGVRLHLTSCGRRKISTAQSKRRRWRDLTPHGVSTYVLTAVRRVGRATTRTRRAHGQYGMDTPSESVPGTSSRNKGMSSGGAGGPGSDARFRLGRAVRAHARGWLPIALQFRRCVSCGSDRWRLAAARDVRTRPYYTWAGQIHVLPFLL